MPRDQDKIPHVGRQSGKSSNRWFGRQGHPKGHGASAGDGKTSDASIVGKIIPVFRKGNRDK